MESYNTGPSVSGFFHFAQCFQVHSCRAGVSTSPFLYSWIIFHCMERPHFVFPFIRWGILGWFLPTDCCEQGCYEHLGSSFCLNTCFLIFLWPHLWHMDVPGLGVKSELKLKPIPQSQRHRIQATSSTCTTACSNARSLTHWKRPGIEPASSWIPVRFSTHWATMRTPFLMGTRFPVGIMSCLETT